MWIRHLHRKTLYKKFSPFQWLFIRYLQLLQEYSYHVCACLQPRPRQNNFFSYFHPLIFYFFEYISEHMQTQQKVVIVLLAFYNWTWFQGANDLKGWVCCCVLRKKNIKLLNCYRRRKWLFDKPFFYTKVLRMDNLPIFF